jgi:hypothetical protein
MVVSLTKFLFREQLDYHSELTIQNLSPPTLSFTTQQEQIFPPP